MSMYPWNFDLEVWGYTFVYMEHDNGQYGILVPKDADMSDEDYVAALEEALRIFEFVEMFHTIHSAFGVWYKRTPYGDYFEQAYDRTQVLHLVHKFLAQDELTIPDWMVGFADDLANNNRPPKPDPINNKKKSESKGYIYLLKAENGYHKIGRTVDPTNRAKTFGVKLPFNVEFECIVQTDNMRLLEEQLHKQYSDKRVNGEWFNLSPEDVEYIRGLAK